MGRRTTVLTAGVVTLAVRHNKVIDNGRGVRSSFWQSSELVGLGLSSFGISNITTTSNFVIDESDVTTRVT